MRQHDSRIRLPVAHLDERNRFESVVQMAMQDVLPRALADVRRQHGLDLATVLCIREVRVRAAARATAADVDWLQHWYDCFRAELHELLKRRENTEVVRYASRGAALIDYARSVLKGRLARAWAWKQLGFASIDLHDSVQRRAAQLAHTMTNEQAIAMATLRALSKRGLAGSFLAALSDDLIVHLADSLWSFAAPRTTAAARTHDMVEAGDGLFERAVERRENGAEQCESVRNAIRRIVHASKLISAIDPASIAPAQPRSIALAMLVVLEVEPAGVLRPREEVEATVLVLSQVLAGSRRLKVMHVDADRATSRPSIEQRSHKPLQSKEVRVDGPREDTRREGRVAQGLRDDVADPRAPLPSSDARSASDEPTTGSTLEQRDRATTSAGGLLLLIRPLDALCFAERISSCESLGNRPLPWILHQLAIRMLALENRDAAALAFAGIAPTGEPPDASHSPSEQEEDAELQHWIDTLAKYVGGLLAWPREDRVEQLRMFCRRRAEIVADPGWIEVHFSLCDITTPVRRAGLDLDPGFVPWLGVTVRYIYA